MASRGVSLIEMVFVLVLVAVLGFQIVPRMAALGEVGVNQAAEQLRRDLTRVQLMAISQAQRLRVDITANGYAVLSCTSPASCGTAVPDPETGSDFVVALGETVLSASGALDFDTLGRPSQAAALTSTATTFTLTRNGKSARVEVLPLTGYARVN